MNEGVHMQLVQELTQEGSSNDSGSGRDDAPYCLSQILYNDPNLYSLISIAQNYIKEAKPLH